MQREQLGAAHAGLATGACQALGQRLAADGLVAFGSSGDRSSAQLRRDVAAVSRALPDAPAGSQVLLVIRADRYAFLVGLLAVWRRGYLAALPPEHDREGITALASQSVTVLHDTASGAALRIGPLLEAAAQQGDVHAEANEWSGLACQGRLYQRAVDGSLQSASPDEAWLERAFELSQQLQLAPGQRCATSVGPGHPHGVLLGIVAPLLAGAAFLREPLAGPALRSALVATFVDLLISVPAQLAALTERSGAPAGRVGRVVSALEPLPSELRVRSAQQLAAPVEDRHDWLASTPLLRSGEQPDPDAQQDEALLALVREAPGVRDAAVLTLRGPVRPSRCVAVVGPAPTDDQRAPLPLASLRALVAQHDPRAELLAVREIRRDALGRFQRGALLRLFGRRADGSAIQTELRWGEASHSTSADYSEYQASVQLPTDYAYFDGHFPGYPILPGAAQLSELVLPLVRRMRPDLGPLRTMSRLKFSGRIQPGETVNVMLRGRPADLQLDFTLRRAQTLCAAGSLSFAAGGAPKP